MGSWIKTLAGMGLAAALGTSAKSADCGGADDACELDLGSYYALSPEGPGPHPAMVFLHGGGGWGSRIFKQRRKMADDFVARGYVVLAPNGKKRPGSKFGPGWAFIPQFEPHRDDLAFVRQVLDDAGDRFGIDRDRVLLTGYSIGGSQVSYLACKAPGLAAAYAPIAGGFWNPPPEDCAGPVKLLHTHGWRDQTVPLEGRPLGNIGVEQGDIYQTLAQWRQQNGCAKYRPDTFVTEGPFWRRIWTHCDAGALEFALHPGGHEVPDAWAPLAIDWFEKVLLVD
ncbi:MAG: dienelactone hydrolase family protein [Pseudomonadota bacterium]